MVRRRTRRVGRHNTRLLRAAAQEGPASPRVRPQQKRRSSCGTPGGSLSTHELSRGGVPRSRGALIGQVATHLERQHWPRTTLATILAVSGFVAFLASYLALSAGLVNMAIRYGLSALVGYLTFLACVRLWVHYHSEPSDQDLGTFDPVDAADLLAQPGTPDSFSFGGSGDFSGGGATRAFDTPVDAISHAGDPSASDGLDLFADTGEGAVVFIPIALAGALLIGVLSTATVVIGAPALLAEVAIDAAIAGTIYRRLVRLPPQHWVRGAVARTWRPMLAIGVTAVLLALLVQWLVPSAASIGDVFRVTR